MRVLVSSIVHMLLRAHTSDGRLHRMPLRAHTSDGRLHRMPCVAFMRSQLSELRGHALRCLYQKPEIVMCGCKLCYSCACLPLRIGPAHALVCSNCIAVGNAWLQMLAATELQY